MRIAFYNILGENKNAEKETLMRLQYVFLKQKHEFFVIDRDGFVINKCADKGRFVEDLNIDLAFTYDPLEFALIALPDVFFSLLHWTPVGFFENFKARVYLESFYLYDYVACSGEQKMLKKYVQKSSENIVLFGPSVPVDYIVKPKMRNKWRLFYIGINFERALANMRYGALLGDLDKTGQLEIYGPRKVYGKRNLWAGFKSYRGEIPFDGHSVIEKISQAGVCLALSSPMHNDAGMITNRTYEAAAAGALIISDDNEFVHKYFGGSVFYIERDLSENEASHKIMNILKWANEHPDEAYDMACRSQKVFLEKLTLDQMVNEFTEKAATAIKEVHNKSLQPDVIDVICFADEKDDYTDILGQLEKQYYQNLHLILVCDQALYKNLVITYPHNFVERGSEDRGRCFADAMELLQGEYFMFIDKDSILHARHIYKNHEVLSQRDELFIYSGCYLKSSQHKGKKYIVMNNKPILRDEFLLFSNASCENTDWYFRDRQTFYIETIFSRSAALFKRSILDYADKDELLLISDSVHMYLACCSIIKANRLGRFSYALTTGYWGNSVQEVEKSVFTRSRRHWYTNNRSAKTYIKELNVIFASYTIESNPNSIPSRNFDGENTWFGEMPYSEATTQSVVVSISWKRKFVRFIKKLIPASVKVFVKKCIYV